MNKWICKPRPIHGDETSPEYNFFDGERYIGCFVVGKDVSGIEEAKQITRLMKSAPDMLLALKKIATEHYEMRGDYVIGKPPKLFMKDVRNIACDAIKKAEGE